MHKQLKRGYMLGMTCLAALVFTVFLSACGTSTDSSNGTSTTGLPQVTTTATTTSGTGSTTTTSSQGSTQGANTLTYANIVITFLSNDQKTSFADDTNSSGPYVIRVSFKEQNPTNDSIYAYYSDNLRLILPDGTSVVPTMIQNDGGLSQGITRNNWADFSVNSQQTLSSIILRIGGTSEHQMDVPLTSNPDLSKYQAITITPNTKVTYDQLTWTITKATASLSANGKQADKGKRYITVNLQADNSTNDTIYPYLDSNLRLKADGVTQAPSQTSPDSVAAHSTVTTGVVTFLMPQTSENFTLDFLAQPDQKITEATSTFTIQNPEK